MKKLFAAIALLAGVTWLAPGVAQATDQVEEPEVCYEYREVPIYEDIIEEGTPAIWQNFSPDNVQGRYTGPPSWPTDPDGTWHHEDKTIPPGQAGPDGVYQNGNGNGSWFYRQAATEDKVVGQIQVGTEIVQVEVPCPPPTIPPVIPPPVIDPCVVNPSFCPPPVEPPVVEPPVVEPPEVIEPPVVEPEQPEVVVPPANTPPPPPPAADAPPALPVTGTSSWIIGILAGILTAAGGSMLYVSRRKNAASVL